MEQYEQFRVPGEGDAGSSNEFDLVFKTEDADGDISSTTVNVPLEVVDQTINADNEAVSNGNDTIVITGGDGVAGTVAAGDSGGMTEGQQVEANYNVCFILDKSSSMNNPVEGSYGSSRAATAKESILNFIDSIGENADFTDGSVTIAIIPFAAKAASPIEITVTVENGEINYTYGGEDYDSFTEPEGLFGDSLEDKLDRAISFASVGSSSDTNYAYAFTGAAGWYQGIGENVGNATNNITYFLTDGRPAGAGTDNAYVDDYKRAWQAYQSLLASLGDSNNSIHAIGFGSDLSDTDMKNLAMFDNTPKAEGDASVASGGFAAADGVYVPESGRVTYQKVDSGNIYPQKSYYVQDKSGWHLVTYENIGSSLRATWEWGYKGTNERWHETSPSGKDKYDFYEAVITSTISGGTSQQVTDGDSLTAAFTSGFNPGALVAAGDDTITAEDSTSSVIVYGDVMNTDRLRYELLQIANGEATLIAVLPGYGAGMELFQWLEKHGTDSALKDTKFEGWTREDSIKYMLEHADELGYETRVDTDGNPYLVAPDGSVGNVDGSKANVDLDSLTGRTGGNDSTTGSEGDDIFFGQEGEDQLFGAAGDDTLYGGTGDDLLVGDARPESLTADTLEEIKTLGTGDALDAFIDSVEGTDADGNAQLFGGVGNDVLLGMGGDDYLDGGAGEDAIFGGAGNDIIVYDNNDYLVSGGSGIDFMVSDDKNLTLSSLLDNSVDDKPLVSGIEVLLKGEDALSLTSLDQLAKEYGITLDTNAEGKETLILDMDKWTEQKDGIYAFNGGAEAGGLTLETNLTPVEASDPASEAVQQQVFTLEHGNG